MRKSYSFYSLLTLSSVFLFGNCSIIAEVDRTKIPQDGGQPEGGEGQTGGSGGSRGGTGGRGGTAGAAGAGDGGMGGDAGGDTGGTSTGGDAGAGMGGTDMGGAGMGGAGDGGTGGSMDPECGDSTIDTGENCDDGDMTGGDGCSATCQEEAGFDCGTSEPSVCTPVCGDGMVVTGEACDDGNSLSCGTCAGNAQGTVAGCTTVVGPAAATGSITTVAFNLLRDGTTFTLNDGYSAATTFEFDSDSPGNATGTPIDISTGVTDDATLQAAIIAAINAVGDTLRITASGGTAPQVILTHDRMTSAGTQAINKGGPDSGADVTVTGMAGGRAGNCLATEPCASDADCKSLDCNSSNLCTAP